MWHNQYEDCPNEDELRKEKAVEGKHFNGCEMNEIAGWGECHHRPRGRGPGIFSSLMALLFGVKIREDDR